MEKYMEVMKQSTELLETVLEGLQHIQNLLNEGKAEDSIFLFEDTILAFSTIENSLKEFPEEFLSSDLNSRIDSVRNVLEMAVSAYETKDYAKLKEVFQFTLVPRYKKLKEDLENTFNPYLVS